MRLRTKIKKSLLQTMVHSGLLTRLERMREPANTLRVLAYHRIAEIGNGGGCLDPTLISASPKTFKLQMEFLANKYRPISAETLLAALDGAASLPSRAVLVTFDDGYRDFMEVAWPIMQEAGVPAVLFVPTSFMNGSNRMFWWDQFYQAVSQTSRTELVLPAGERIALATAPQRQAALSRLKAVIEARTHAEIGALIEHVVTQLGVRPQCGNALLAWSDLRKLNHEGVAICAHTRSHPLVSRLADQELADEIAGAQQELEMELKHTWPLFSYPNGSRKAFDQRAIDLLAAQKCKAAFTLIPGINQLGTTFPLRFFRINVSPRIDPVLLRVCLTRPFQPLLKIKKLLRR